MTAQHKTDLPMILEASSFVLVGWKLRVWESIIGINICMLQAAKTYVDTSLLSGLTHTSCQGDAHVIALIRLTYINLTSTYQPG